MFWIMKEVSPLTSGRLSHSSGPLNGGGSFTETDSPPISPSDDFDDVVKVLWFLTFPHPAQVTRHILLSNNFKKKKRAYVVKKSTVKWKQGQMNPLILQTRTDLTLTPSLYTLCLSFHSEKKHMFVFLQFIKYICITKQSSNQWKTNTLEMGRWA